MSEIFALPGNGGISKDATCVDIGAKDIAAMVDFAVDNKIDYAIVAPDDPLVLGAVGVYLVIHPEAFLSMVAVVFGIFIVYNAIIDLQSALTMKKGGYVYWYVALIISLATLASGIILILLKNKAAEAIALATGIILIIQGIMNIWVAVKVKKFNE